jgi:hypothetical protein
MIALGAQSITNFAGSSIVISGPSPLGLMVTNAQRSTQVFSCNSFDGAIDYVGSSGITVLAATTDPVVERRVYGLGDAGFSAFIASGLTLETMPIRMEATGLSGYVATGGVDRWIETAAWGLVTVEYEYIEDYVETTSDSGLGYLVWWDHNADGIQDADEAGIAGATVILKDASGTELGNVTTDADGVYGFGTLFPGTYTVEVILPSGVPAGTVQTYDLDGLGTPNLTTVDLPASTIRDDVNFGYRNPVSCSVTADTTTVCEGGTATFAATVSGGIPPFTYLWSGPESFLSQDAAITAEVAGTYDLVVTDSTGNTSTCSATLTVNPAPVVTLTLPTCLPSAYSWCNTLSAPAGFATYSWTLVDGQDDCWQITSGADTRTVKYKAGRSGTYATFQVDVTNADGCSASATVTFRTKTSCWDGGSDWGHTGGGCGGHHHSGKGCGWHNGHGGCKVKTCHFVDLNNMCLKDDDGRDCNFGGTLEQKRCKLSDWFSKSSGNMACTLSKEIAKCRINVALGKCSGNVRNITHPLCSWKKISARELIDLGCEKISANPYTRYNSSARYDQEKIKNCLANINTACGD